jgi:1-hydroxy-2-naphthoate dioxygenase
MKTIRSLEEFTHALNAQNMRGQWQADELLQRAIGGPKPAGVPFIWPWESVHRALLEACEVMPESMTARRNISFANPGLGAKIGTSHTIVAGIQMVMPGEVAWAHRHTLGAVRFGIEGNERLYSVVDGEALPMLPNDLVLTPNWTWHDHHNESGATAIWLDVLDVPLVSGSLNQTFYEPLGETTQPRREQLGDYISERAKLMRPTWERRPVQNVPFRYAWSDVEPVLDAYAKAGREDPYDGLMLEYVNPMTGGPTLPTLSCRIQRLPPGRETKPHRHTSSAFYFAVRGAGATTVDGQTLEWSERDSFVVPNWSRHHHVNRSSSEEAILFCVTDEPVLAALGLLRHDPDDGLVAAPFVPANEHRSA